MPKKRHPYLILIVIALAQFMVILDATIVNVALPTIQRDLHFSVASLQWVVTGYTLSFGGFLLLGGRLADLFGRRLLFYAGLIIFSGASLAGGFAHSETWLISARIVQGFGGAMLSPAALSILLNTFAEGKERNLALGVWGGVVSAGAAVGLLLGGLITQYLGWAWVFFVNAPVGVLALIAASQIVPESKSSDKSSTDIIGAVTVTAGLMLLVYGLVKAPDYGWFTARTEMTLIGSLILLAAFVYNENRQKYPLMPLRIFRIRNVSASNAIQLPVSSAFFAMFFFLSLYTQQLLGWSPLKAGLAYLPVTVVIGISAGLGSQLVNKIGFKKIMIAGPIFLAVGLWMLTGIPVHGTYLGTILPPMTVIGFGMGALFVASTIAATNGVPPGESGLASGLINTSGQIGGALGLAILTAVAASQTKSYINSHAQAAVDSHTTVLAFSQQSTVHGFHWAFIVGAFMAIAASVIALFAFKEVKQKSA
jgi:EmrB/QacA subfamily drug resistance transporter